MKNKYWFVPKTYGYGYVPTTWEGWICVLILIGILLLIAYVNNFFTPSGPTTQEGFRYLLDLILITLTINPIMVSRTKGEVKWNWGKN